MKIELYEKIVFSLIMVCFLSEPATFDVKRSYVEGIRVPVLDGTIKQLLDGHRFFFICGG